ncbi:hypothetical protein Q604_UNBC17562G0001, partial [human gut metagenome]
NGKALSNAGVVPPKSQRQTSWCQAIAPCHVSWRTINDYGGLSAKKEQNLLLKQVRKTFAFFLPQVNSLLV